MKSFRIFPLVLVAFFPLSIFAQVYINEISYSPVSKAWIEIWNNTASSIDLSTYKILDAGAASTGHSISSPAIVPAYGYAVVGTSGAVSNFGAVSWSLFQSAIKPNTSGDTIILKDAAKNIVDQKQFVSSDGASGDGNSLQRQADGSWIVAVPTPGVVNASSVAVSDNSNNQTATTTDQTADTSTTQTSSQSSSSANISAYSSPAPLSQTAPTVQFTISAGRDRLTTVGNTLLFMAAPVTLPPTILQQGISWQWSFGDGTTGQGNSVHHTYGFAGEYTVVLNASYSDKMAVSEAGVKVIMPNILLSRVDGGLQITNNSGEEINLEGWNLVSDKKVFVFPQDTLISAGNKITFADSVTGVNNGEVDLLNQMQKVFATVGASPENISATQPPTSSPVSLADIQTKVNAVKNKLAQISVAVSPQQPKVIVTTSSAPKLEMAPDMSIATSTENVAGVFNAAAHAGIVSSILSWPGRGFNFIKHLFVEQ